MSCLMHDTPLGQVVAVRSESNPEVLKTFTKEQNNIRNEWLNRRNGEQNGQDYKESMDRLFSMALV